MGDRVAATSATFHGELNPLGAEAEWWVEYGTTTAYGKETPAGSLAAGFGDVPVAPMSRPPSGHHLPLPLCRPDEREGNVYTVHGPDRMITTQLSGLGFQLPDDRAWEMVSPPDKHGGVLMRAELEGVIQAAADGNARHLPERSARS